MGFFFVGFFCLMGFFVCWVFCLLGFFVCWVFLFVEFFCLMGFFVCWVFLVVLKGMGDIWGFFVTFFILYKFGIGWFWVDKVWVSCLRWFGK